MTGAAYLTEKREFFNEGENVYASKSISGILCNTILLGTVLIYTIYFERIIYQTFRQNNNTPSLPYESYD